MATFRELTNTAPGRARHQAMVRRGGHALSRTFPTAKAAAKWAGLVEAAISLDSPVNPFNREDWLPRTQAKRDLTKRMMGNALDEPNPGWTMGKALDRYLDEVGDKKASPQQEATRTRLLKASLGSIPLSRLRTRDVQAHADARLAAGKGAATVRLEVMHVRAVWKHARREQPHGWGLALPEAHPCAGIVLPPPNPGRTRRLQDADQQEGTDAEEASIRKQVSALGIPDADVVMDVFELGLLTGMRRGEILSMTKGEVQRTGNVWMVVKGRHKTMHHGHVRSIVLPPGAVDIVRRRLGGADEKGRLFTIRTDRFRHYFRKACRLAGVADFRFHDVRHEALSRMADRNLDIGQLRAQSGHRSAQMLLRYVNARPKDILAKLS